MLRAMEPGNEHILTRDFYGQTIIGKPSDVEYRVNNQRLQYNEAVGENIRGGFFGAAFYLWKGDKASFVGGLFDQVGAAMEGFPAQSGRLTKAREQSLFKTEQVFRAKNSFFTNVEMGKLDGETFGVRFEFVGRSGKTRVAEMMTGYNPDGYNLKLEHAMLYING